MGKIFILLFMKWYLIKLYCNGLNVLKLHRMKNEKKKKTKMTRKIKKMIKKKMTKKMKMKRSLCSNSN